VFSSNSRDSLKSPLFLENQLIATKMTKFDIQKFGTGKCVLFMKLPYQTTEVKGDEQMRPLT